MNNKKMPYVSIFFAIILIVFGFSLEFISAYQVDAKETDQSRQTIDRNYSNINNELNALVKSLKIAGFNQSKYYEEIINKNDKYLLEIDTVNNRVTNIVSLTEKVLAECVKMPEVDRDITSKCEVLKKNKELVVNTYISVIEVFNEEVELCNDWLLNNSKEASVKKYSNEDFPNYMDLDSDGVYNGKF